LIPILEAEEAARIILDAMLRDERDVFIPRRLSALFAPVNLFPLKGSILQSSFSAENFSDKFPSSNVPIRYNGRIVNFCTLHNTSKKLFAYNLICAHLRKVTVRKSKMCKLT
jgi:hypothetical protein